MKKQETRKTGVKVEECSLTALTWAREGDREKVRPSVETVITPSNILILSELIAMQALRSIVPYTGKLFIQMQRSLYKDIFRRTDIHHQLSEGYDLIQTAACFLCGYMGKKINRIRLKICPTKARVYAEPLVNRSPFFVGHLFFLCVSRNSCFRFGILARCLSKSTRENISFAMNTFLHFDVLSSECFYIVTKFFLFFVDFAVVR